MLSTGRTRGLSSGLLALAAVLAGVPATAAPTRSLHTPAIAPAPPPLPTPDDEADAAPVAAPAPLDPVPAAPPPGPKAPPGPVQTDKLSLYGMMDREVTGPDKSTVGHVVDVLVNADGRLTAVLVETGGFMGVGDRRIAIGWQDVEVDPHDPGGAVHITMTTDQIRAAPAWQAGGPAFVAVGAAPPPPTPGPPPVAAAPAPLPVNDDNSAPLIAPAPAPLPATRTGRGRG